MKLERYITGDTARVYHLAEDGTTLCGKTTILMQRVRVGHRGWDKPECLACQKKLVSTEKRESK